MDVLRFVESEAIKDYWLRIGYEPNSLESAYLIYRCGNATLKEKHEAWNELIETMPDCSVEKRNRWMTAQKSLHDFLRRYMAYEDRYVEKFLDATPEGNNGRLVVYTLKNHYRNANKVDNELANKAFSSFESAKTYYQQNVDTDGIEYIECAKITVDDANDTSFVSISPFFDFMSVGGLSDLYNDGSENSLAFFEGLFFIFPLPFRAGDIVWDPVCRDREPYLVIEDCYKAEAELPTKYKRMYEHGDTTDMQIRLGAAEEHGVSFTHKDYLRLEYYTIALIGRYRHLEEYGHMLVRRNRSSGLEDNKDVYSNYHRTT